MKKDLFLNFLMKNDFSFVGYKNDKYVFENTNLKHFLLNYSSYSYYTKGIMTIIFDEIEMENIIKDFKLDRNIKIKRVLKIK